VENSEAVGLRVFSIFAPFTELRRDEEALGVALSNFKRAQKLNSALHILGTSLGYPTTMILKEVWNYFVRNLLCMTTGFVDYK
jgi:hypothetical protein